MTTLNRPMPIGTAWVVPGGAGRDWAWAGLPVLVWDVEGKHRGQRCLASATWPRGREDHGEGGEPGERDGDDEQQLARPGDDRIREVARVNSDQLCPLLREELLSYRSVFGKSSEFAFGLPVPAHSR